MGGRSVSRVTAYTASTAFTHRHAPSVELYSYTAALQQLYSLQLYSSSTVYSLYNPPLCVWCSSQLPHMNGSSESAVVGELGLCFGCPAWRPPREHQANLPRHLSWDQVGFPWCALQAGTACKEALLHQGCIGDSSCRETLPMSMGFPVGKDLLQPATVWSLPLLLVLGGLSAV